MECERDKWENRKEGERVVVVVVLCDVFRLFFNAHECVCGNFCCVKLQYKKKPRVKYLQIFPFYFA